MTLREMHEQAKLTFGDNVKSVNVSERIRQYPEVEPIYDVEMSVEVCDRIRPMFDHNWICGTGDNYATAVEKIQKLLNTTIEKNACPKCGKPVLEVERVEI